MSVADGVPNNLSFGSESSKVTSLKAPAPLPPSPADGEPDGWLEPMQTGPAKIPDLGALAATGHTDPGSLPSWAKGSRQPSANEELLESRRGGDRSADMSRGRHGATMPPLIVIGLLMAVCLAIGMIIGALLQSRSGPPACPDPALHSGHAPASPTPGS